MKHKKLWDVLIVETKSRKIESVAGTDLPESGSFHTVDKRLLTVADRINDNYFVVAVDAGQFKKGAVLPNDVEKYG